MNISDNSQAGLELWNSYKNGDQEAFGELFRLYYPVLFQFGSRLSISHDLLEDCIQDLFVELWRNKSDSPVLSVKAYLLKSLKYKILRALQKRGHSPLAISDDIGAESSHEFTLITNEEKNEQQAKLTGAMNQLSPRQKEIIYLKYYQELSYEEVSEIMDINYQAARNLLYQSVKALKKILTGFTILILSSLSV